MRSWVQRLSGLREIEAPAARLAPCEQPLRVLHLTNMYPSQGNPAWGVFIQSQIESLAEHGVQSEVVEIEGWRTKLNYARALVALPIRIDPRRYDLLHVHYALNCLACVGVRGLPMVVSFCGDDFWGTPDEHGRRSAASLLLAAMSRHASRRANSIIVKSRHMAAVYGSVHPDVEVIANGVDFGLFEPVPRVEARRRLGWPLEPHILLFPTNPENRNKNFPLARAVEACLREWGLSVRLEWMFGRPQTDVVLAMSAADVMLNCSFQEGSPNAVKEAMAMGLPIVSTDCGDCAERLRNVRPGAVVANDVGAFAAAVRDILADGPRRSNGRDEAMAIDLATVARRVIAVYRRVVARSGSGEQGRR